MDELSLNIVEKSTICHVWIEYNKASEQTYLAIISAYPNVNRNRGLTFVYY